MRAFDRCKINDLRCSLRANTLRLPAVSKHVSLLFFTYCISFSANLREAVASKNKQMIH